MTHIRSSIWALYVLLGAMPIFSQERAIPPFRDMSLPRDVRVSDLISRMTLKEKIAQMQNHAPAITRLGIPAYDWWNEALHGVARNGVATVFPQAIGMAATWNPSLIRMEADVISTEARAKYNEALRQNQHGIYQGLTFWSPNINIFRDPRWGRGQETYGEDPFLTSRIGVAFVQGLQSTDPTYFKVISTPKHFAVHSGPESLRHSFDARTTLRDLYETYLPAFEACIREGGAWSIMGAYNRYDGQPCCASRFLLGEVLRSTWKFPGYVVSDCGAITDIYAGHRVASDAAEAAALAVRAGCDLTCGTEFEALSEAIARGLISEREIDVSLHRLMDARFRLGMFDPADSVIFSRIPLSSNDAPEHDALARHVARESIVLLKNEGGALPLNKDLRSVAVIGPNADNPDILLGNYSGTPSHPVTILQGIRAAVARTTTVLYARGCELADGVVAPLIPIGSQNLRTDRAASARPGLIGEYYSNTEFTGPPAVERNDTVVDFSWQGSPAPGIPAERFSARWKGILIPTVTGTYTVGVTVDDGCRLIINDSIFVEEWRDGGRRTVARQINLSAGEKYDLALEYYQNRGDALVRLGWRLDEKDPLDEALAVARKSEHIIAVLGLSPLLEGEEMSVNLQGFSGGDRTDLTLPASQCRLLKALHALGKPITLVLANGSALALAWEHENIRAIVEAWYPGQQGGNAVADILFGDYNPAGRLPVTFYRSLQDLPPFDHYAMKGRTYRYFLGDPLYPFGYGLSYTRFDYLDVSLEKRQLHPSDTLFVETTIMNKGNRDGDEVVQLYTRRRGDRSPEDPVKSLKGFARVHLARGGTMTVRIPLAVGDLRVYDEETAIYAVKPGIYDLQVGASSADIRLKDRFEVVR